jgi:hypothetical protein
VQGRQQTVFEERAKVIVELRGRLLAADKALALAWTYTDQSHIQDELLDKIGSLGDYYEENNIWLDQQFKEKIAGIVQAYDEQVRALVTGRRGIPPPPHLQGMEPKEIYKEVWRWYLAEGQELASELEVEARRLLGVDRRWWQVWR